MAGFRAPFQEEAYETDIKVFKSNKAAGVAVCAAGTCFYTGHPGLSSAGGVTEKLYELERDVSVRFCGAGQLYQHTDGSTVLEASGK